MKKILKNKKAVSEIVGTIMLLGMAIALFAIVQLTALNYPFNEPRPSVRLSATIDGDTVIVVHQGGESLPLETKIMFVILDENGNLISEDTVSIGDYSGFGQYWNIGEKLLYNPVYPSGGPIDLTDKEVRVTVIDVVTNSVIMQGTVRGDSST